MKITKDFEGLECVRLKYVYSGDIKSEDDLVIDLDKPLWVDGEVTSEMSIRSNVSICAEGNIRAKRWIEVGGYIRTEGHLKAGERIISESHIISGDWIESGKFIEAGGSIEAMWNICVEKSILSQLSVESGGTIAVGENIYAGCCTWRKTREDDELIRCSKFYGTVKHGILKEAGEERHTITIDGKELELSDESYNNLVSFGVKL